MGENNGEAIDVADVKETITRLVESMDAATIENIASELISGDEFPETLVNAYPRFLNLGVQIARALAESLERLPADESAELLAQSLGGVDGRELGEAINSISRLLIALHEARPGLMAESRVSVISDAAGTVDFGKLRLALTAHCRYRLSTLEGKVDHVVGFPLGLANLLNVVPPLVNDLLRIIAKALGYVKLPDELLASALFTLVRDIDMHEVGDVLNAAAEVVIALSHGDRILGSGGDPMLRKVLSSMAEELVAGVDGPRLKEAILALGGDGKIIAEVFSEHVFRNDESTLAFVAALTGALNALMRAACRFSARVSELPPETIARMARQLEDDLQAEELGRTVNAAAALLESICAEDPDLVREIARRSLSTLEPEQVGTAAKAVALQFGEAVDAEGLNRVVAGAVDRIVEAALAHGEMVKAVVKPVVSGLVRYVVGSVRNAGIFRRLRKPA